MARPVCGLCGKRIYVMKLPYFLAKGMCEECYESNLPFMNKKMFRVEDVEEFNELIYGTKNW